MYIYEVEEMEMLSLVAGVIYVLGEFVFLMWDVVNIGEFFSLEYFINVG